jgi:ribonuclease BN (tRNA processing enzyme)
MMRLLAALALIANAALAEAQSCDSAPLQLQILGSGSADTSGKRAGPAALVWIDGKARLLIDAGPAAALRLLQAEANVDDLDAILLSHLRADRTADLASVIGLLGASARTRRLPLYGPDGNRWMPSTVTFVRTLFDPIRGAWRHLGSALSPLASQSYKLEPRDLRQRPGKLSVTRDDRADPLPAFAGERARISALPIMVATTLTTTPMLIWRVEVAGKVLVLAADVTTAPEAVQRFANGADLLVATPLANIETPTDVTALARLARAAKVKRLALSIGSAPTPTNEEETAALIRRHYDGTVDFPNDLNCLTP